METFFIGDKVYHKWLKKKGKIVDIKYVNGSRTYLVKFQMFAYSWNPFARKAWTYGMELELVKRKKRR